MTALKVNGSILRDLSIGIKWKPFIILISKWGVYILGAHLIVSPPCKSGGANRRAPKNKHPWLEINF